MILICFAVKEEAQFFKPEDFSSRPVQMLLTGIGKSNAEKAIRNVVADQTPALVLSCGFAGGLRPELPSGSVVFDVDPETPLRPILISAGAVPVKFHCVERIVTTAREKQALCQKVGADAVEMESRIICDICRSKQIPSATVRVILDSADQDLPLDFNLVMNSEQKIEYSRLAVTLAKSPGKIPELLRLQRQSSAAAKRLADVLTSVLTQLKLSEDRGN